MNIGIGAQSLIRGKMPIGELARNNFKKVFHSTRTTQVTAARHLNIDDIYSSGGSPLKKLSALTGILNPESSIRQVLRSIYSKENKGKSSIIIGPPTSGKTEAILRPFDEIIGKRKRIGLQRIGSQDCTTQHLLMGVARLLLSKVGYTRSEVVEFSVKLGSIDNSKLAVIAENLVEAINKKVTSGLVIPIDEFSVVNRNDSEQFLQLLKIIKEQTQLQFLAAGTTEFEGLEIVFDKVYKVKREPPKTVSEANFQNSIQDPQIVAVLDCFTAQYNIGQIRSYGQYLAVRQHCITEMKEDNWSNIQKIWGM